MENMVEVPLQTGPDNGKFAVNREHVILLAGTLLLGILSNILFYEKEPGVSLLIFVCSFYAVLFLSAGKALIFKPDLSWAPAIPVLLLSLTYLFYSNQMFFVLNMLAIPLLIVVQTVLATGSNTCSWHTPGFLIDIVYGFLYRTFAYIARPLKVIAGIFPRRAGKSGGSVLRRVLLGLLISIPLLLVVVSLLVSADQIFKSYMDRIPNIFADLNVAEIIGRGFFILFIFFTSFSYISSLAERKKPVLPEGGDGSIRLPKVWNHITVITVMLLVNAVYLMFVIIQFAYLFGGVRLDLPADFTYSGYARRGFFELIAVTVINFGILMFCLGFTRMDGGRGSGFLRTLYSLLVGNTLVMLISAYYRMLLYEEAYGFTYLRVLTQSFMIFLLVLFGIMLFRIWRDGISLAKPFIVTAVAAFVIINYVNIDVIIAKNNVDRYYKTNKIDVAYLSTLSYDAVPEIAKLVDAKDGKVAGEVADLVKRKKEEASKNKAWQSFNISRHRAAEFNIP